MSGSGRVRRSRRCRTSSGSSRWVARSRREVKILAKDLLCRLSLTLEVPRTRIPRELPLIVFFREVRSNGHYYDRVRSAVRGALIRRA